MSIYWVRFQGDSALEAMKAIAEALRQDERGEAPVETPVIQEPLPKPEPTDGDDYLQQNLQIMHTTWSIDPLRPELPADQRLITRLRVHLQHLIRRLTRFYVMSPWLQANEFHGAIVRIIEVLLARQEQWRREMNEYQYRLQAAEQQILFLRNELAMARQQVAGLQQYLYRVTQFDQE
ncbi:MAG: hypothetical protein K6356_06520 [Chloroflexus sp.]